MPFYTDRVYPCLVSTLGDPKPIRMIRQRIIPLAQGNILEIGVGSGHNFAHYDPARVSKLFALEPNPAMIRLAKRQLVRTTLDVEFLGLPGERIPLADASVDTVVSTFTLGTIADVTKAIQGVVRVLRADGRLIFFELSLSPDWRVRRWQRRWEPLLGRMYAGLRPTRDIPALLREGGFCIEWMETAYLTRFPKSWAHSCWGVATLGAR